MASPLRVVTMVTPVANRRLAALKASIDTGTDSQSISDRNDRRVKLRVVDKCLAESAQRLQIGRIRGGRFLRGVPAPEQVVDDDEARAFEHRNAQLEVVFV